MNHLSKQIFKLASRAMLYAAMLCGATLANAAQDATGLNAALPGAELDLSIHYFNRVLSSDGVVHESQYTEKMLRRRGHVWSYREIPARVAEQESGHEKHEHKEFNYLLLPRHVSVEEQKNGKMTVEFVDSHDKKVILIQPTEYENVNFDGSWLNTFYLVSPAAISVMPKSKQVSSVAQARWYEAKKNGLFQRILWDEKNLVPLLIETGDQKNTFFQRITVSLKSPQDKALPWLNLQGYAQKEYSDFLD
jgi:hypothetical protein